MKFFTNKKTWQKIVIVLVFVILFEFIVTSPVDAGVDGDVLLQPVTNLFVSLADALMAILQDILLQTGR